MAQRESGMGARAAWRRVFGDWVGEVGPATLRADALAGLLGALLVLPQGVAFATLAGLPPEYGLYSAVVPCVLAALFGSSRHVMSGPTNANSLALFAVLAPLAAAGSPRYIELALAVTVLVGLLQLAVGLLRLGALANFISPSALFGFTSGAALLIALHALGDALGVEPAGPGTLGVVAGIASGLPHIQWAEVAVAASTLAVAMLARRLDRRKPYMLAGLAAGMLMAAALQAAKPGLSISLLGPLAQPWPQPHLPAIDWRLLPELLGLAVPLTIVALAQSISIALAIEMDWASASTPAASSSGRACPTRWADCFPVICRAAR